MSAEYQVGDKVWIEHEITNVYHNQPHPIEISYSPFSAMRISVELIKHHIPKPREFKPGDKVRSGLDKADYELVATRGQVAFLWCQEQLYGRTAPLDTIRHVDEAAP